MNEEKYRHELKFVISRSQAEILENSLSGIMKKDRHLVGEFYNIRSVYFDDIDHTCFFENENGTDPREKFRIRIYNNDDSFIRLELKKKNKGMTQKLQCEITREQVEKIFRGESLGDFEALPPLLKKFELQRMCRLLSPDILVDYDRIPYVYDLGNVRITFDMNMASSTQFGSFFQAELPKRPILQQDMMLLEVKYDEFLPDYIEKLIAPQVNQRTSFSKYYLCKKYS